MIIPEENKILLSQIFNWYAKDFGTRKDILEFLICYLYQDQKKQYLAQHMDTIETEYLFYDWNLNH